jgi:hypothetical protein
MKKGRGSEGKGESILKTDLSRVSEEDWMYFSGEGEKRTPDNTDESEEITDAVFD